MTEAVARRQSLAAADLIGLDLRHVNLRGANLAGAKLDETCLARLLGTNWRDATWDEDVRKRLEDMHRDEA